VTLTGVTRCSGHKVIDDQYEEGDTIPDKPQENSSLSKARLERLYLIGYLYTLAPCATQAN